MKNIAVITYDQSHLKTEQVTKGLIEKGHDPKNLTLYALPFKPFKKRDPVFNHRPDHTTGLSPQVISETFNIRLKNVMSDTDIPDAHDLYIIAGAGILSPEFVTNKKVLNIHPGLIPLVRGLDSFKWAIHDKQPLGNTLHYIDAEVDKGEVISVSFTSVLKDDSITDLAKRHYEQEIEMLVNFEEQMESPELPPSDWQQRPATMRMKAEQEKEMLDRFNSYKEFFAGADK